MNVGDWVFFDYKLGQITEINERGWWSVSDGCGETSGARLSERCFPLDLQGQRLSDYFQYYTGKIREKEGSINLNWPDIHEKSVQNWVRCMEVRNTVGGPLAKRQEEARQFFEEVISLTETARAMKTESGIRLLR